MLCGLAPFVITHSGSCGVKGPVNHWRHGSIEDGHIPQPCPQGRSRQCLHHPTRLVRTLSHKSRRIPHCRDRMRIFCRRRHLDISASRTCSSAQGDRVVLAFSVLCILVTFPTLRIKPCGGRAGDTANYILVHALHRVRCNVNAMLVCAAILGLLPRASHTFDRELEIAAALPLCIRSGCQKPATTS